MGPGGSTSRRSSVNHRFPHPGDNGTATPQSTRPRVSLVHRTRAVSLCLVNAPTPGVLTSGQSGHTGPVTGPVTCCLCSGLRWPGSAGGGGGASGGLGMGWWEAARGAPGLLTFPSGGVLLLQDDPLSIQARYGGAEVQGLPLATLETKAVHHVTHQTRTFQNTCLSSSC